MDWVSYIHVERSAKQSKRLKLQSRNPSPIIGIFIAFLLPPVACIGKEGFPTGY